MRWAVWRREELGDTRTAVERADCKRMGLGGAREREWIAGRAAAHLLIGDVDVVTAADGAPIAERSAVSLSHDGEWVAAAAAPRGRVAIDLCCIEHEVRVARILERLGLRGTMTDPCATWAALECALKLRRRGVWSLLDAQLAISGGWVRGIGDDVRVEWTATAEYALAWAWEADHVAARVAA